MKLPILSLALLCVGLSAAEIPPQTPRLQVLAEFTEKTRCPVYAQGEAVSLWIAVDGQRVADEELQWNVKDFRGQVRGAGELTVPKGDARWSSILRLGAYGAGYFEVHLKLKNSGVTLLPTGSRPAGFAAYAVLPPIERLPLAHVDDSRFGAQGTNFVESGKWMQGDYLNPVYPLTGLKWVYMSRRLAEIAGKGPDSFVPVTDPAEWKKRPGCETKNDMCVFIDAFSVPGWLIKVPESAKDAMGKFSATNGLQDYPPGDWEAYGKLIGQVAAEQAARRQALFPRQAKNYYEIHWEPDWHWKGSDEEFIKMYEVARKAIHANDPDGLLLGANYGVLATGNRHLERLFAKGLGKHLDGIVTHLYYIPLKQTPESGGVVRDMRHLREMTEQHLPKGAPIVMSEWGVSDLGRIPQDQEVAWFMRGHLIGLGEGARSTFFFYTADMGESGGLFYNLTTPNPVFGATHVAPKLLFSACAAATRLLDGTSNLGALEYLGDDTLGYAFNRGGVPLLSLWTTSGGDKPVTLPWTGPAPILYDPVGNPTILQPKDGKLTVTAGPIPTYILGGDFNSLPATSDPRPAYAARPGEALNVPNAATPRLWRDGKTLELEAGGLVPRAAKSGQYLLQTAAENWRMAVLPAVELSQATDSLILDNKTATAVNGALTLTCAGKELSRRQLSLPAKTRTTLPLAIDKASLSATAASEIAAVWRDELNREETLTLPPARPTLSPHRASQPPVIDGEFDHWDLELFQTLDQPGAVIINAADWRGPADLSYRMAIRYDDNALYLAFRVRDQDQRSVAGVDAYKGDSVQLGLATAPDDPKNPGLQKFCFSLDPANGHPRIWRHEGKDFPRWSLPTDGPIHLAVKREGEETRYEVAIPWSQIDKAWTSFPAGGQLGVGVLVNDVDLRDNELTKRKAMEAFGGMGWTKPEEFGRLLFPAPTP